MKLEFTYLSWWVGWLVGGWVVGDDGDAVAGGTDCDAGDAGNAGDAGAADGARAGDGGGDADDVDGSGTSG